MQLVVNVTRLLSMTRPPESASREIYQVPAPPFKKRKVKRKKEERETETTTGIKHDLRPIPAFANGNKRKKRGPEQEKVTKK